MQANLARSLAGGSEVVEFQFAGNGTGSYTDARLVGKKNFTFQGGTYYMFIALAGVCLENGFKFAVLTNSDSNLNFFTQPSNQDRLAQMGIDPETGTITFAQIGTFLNSSQYTYTICAW